ncbi:hypothetical protein MTF65_24405 [Streptomyces sp. APSN-46.1]|uniref:hypothetical protein n=1 Tax=Streptomyces sp. APSN-46.1 TaxID=2929049 RepID=UPI001FB27F0E|nr:hypothetical protein [Streptomyces sp. APSN-46.1]MCJ1680428.1 hypothetical protein [Streptomyces sp. APSN-46.1]
MPESALTDGRPAGILLEVARVDPPHGPAEQRRAGRTAAGTALRRAGSAVLTVGRRSDGAPVFPDGFAGAITHTPSFAVAVVARGVTGIGVDLETGHLGPGLDRYLLNDTERALLWPDRSRQTLRRLFVAKEAGFKALSDCRPAHGGLFWRVRLSRSDGLLWARAGADRALVTLGGTRAFAFAVAVRHSTTHQA